MPDNFWLFSDLVDHSQKNLATYKYNIRRTGLKLLKYGFGSEITPNNTLNGNRPYLSSRFRESGPYPKAYSVLGLLLRFSIFLMPSSGIGQKSVFPKTTVPLFWKIFSESRKRCLAMPDPCINLQVGARERVCIARQRKRRFPGGRRPKRYHEIKLSNKFKTKTLVINSLIDDANL